VELAVRSLDQLVWFGAVWADCLFLIRAGEAK